MELKIVIKYDAVEKTIQIEENDFTTFEACGILEAAKAMITNDWLEKEG